MRNGSLVAFTLLIQSAVGVIWALFPLHWTHSPAAADIARWSGYLALGFSLCGLVCAAGHLGSPPKAYHALRNLPHSWLSREILAVSGFTIMLVGFLCTLRFGSGQWMVSGAVICALGGGVVLFTMVRVYGLKTVPVWNNVSTALDFIGSTLILGSILGLGIAALAVPDGGRGSPAVLFIAVGMIGKAIAGFVSVHMQRLSSRRSWYAAPPRSMPASVATAVGMGLHLSGAGAVFLGLYGQHRFIWTVAALVLCSLADTWGRWRFYDRYVRIGL